LTAVRKTTEASSTIRDMTAGDMARIIELEREIFPDPWPRSAFKEQTSGGGWGAIVAEVDGVVIGYGCYFTVDIEAHLTNIAVTADYRRKSVAKRLLDTILERATGSDCEYLLLEVRHSNNAARAFYEKHGFSVLYQRPNYYRRPVESALVMVRYLDPNREE